MLRGEQHGIEHADNLVEVASGRHRIGQRELDTLIWANHKDSPNRCVERWCPALATIPCIGGENVMKLRHFWFPLPPYLGIYLYFACGPDAAHPPSLAF